MKEKGLLLVISGPSGVGKGTICSKLMSERDNIKMSVSVTTRQPRPGETEGVSYFFRTEEEFMKMVEADAFLEYMCVFGKNTALPRAMLRSSAMQALTLYLR